MDPVANAALTSWNYASPAIWLLLLTGIIYFRGWLRGRQFIRSPRDGKRLAAFLAGLLLLLVATESPLDAFDSLYLSAHMTQHLLLMMFAPPLLLLGDPFLPLLRGLPRKFVKEGLGPFLSWPALRKVGGCLVSPPLAWLLFAFSTVFWHLPRFYELALSTPVWHGLQHASFFWTGVLFWWFIVEPAPAKARWPLWAKIPYLLFSDLVNTALSAFFVFSGHLLYPTYGATQMGGLTPQDDQTIAGLIMWVPGSMVYLLPAFLIAMRLLGTGREFAPRFQRVQREAHTKLNFNWRLVPKWRRAGQIIMLLLAVAVVSDGFFGPPVTPLNLAGILPWIHWRAFSVIALAVVGNLFCMTCPFVLVRDFGRKLFPPKLRWPRYLRNKWLPAALLVLYLWCYEAFDLWDKPFVTACVIVGYFAAALLIDGLFRGASFCKYVCPIGQFQFVSSLISPREVTIKRAGTCQSCNTYDCIRGNDTARGCELYLFQPKKTSNMDCTFCLDCVKACPHGNVAILPVSPVRGLTNDSYRSSVGRLSKRTDLAALVLVFVFGAFANAAGMVSPVMMREHSWHARLGVHAMPLVVGIFTFFAVVLLPALSVGLAGILNGLSTRVKEFKTVDLVRRLVFAFIPLGFAMWGAHLLYHLATGWQAPMAVLTSRFLRAGELTQAGVMPSWLTAFQLLVLDAGLLLTLYLLWRIIRGVFNLRASLALSSPWAALAIGLYSAGAWILFQPMQMRGMMH